MTDQYTNAVVGGIEATVYRDADMKESDPARSFRVQFFPATGALRMFNWSDNHAIMSVRGYITYAKHLEGETWMHLVWDGSGTLLSSNVYNWALRGRVIGGDIYRRSSGEIQGSPGRLND